MKKKKGIKSTPSYKQGWNDADVLIRLGVSLWWLTGSGIYARKSKQSHPKLYRYCEGYNDRVAKEAEKKGITIPVHAAFGVPMFSQDAIGR